MRSDKAAPIVTVGIIATIALLVACATPQQRAERQQQKAAETALAIDSMRLHIDVTMMNTLRYGSRNVTSDFYLELRGDTLVSYLPYLGQVHGTVAAYGSAGQGLNFTAPIDQMTKSNHKHGMTRLEMLVHSKEERHIYTLEVYPNGQAYINVRSGERDPISFDGSVKTEK